MTQSNKQTKEPGSNKKVELLWTLVATVLFGIQYFEVTATFTLPIELQTYIYHWTDTK